MAEKNAAGGAGMTVIAESTLEAEAAKTQLHVRPARPDDVDEIIKLLVEGFHGNDSTAEKWRNLFDYPHAQLQPNLGFMLLSGDQLVGFLGTIYSDRKLGTRVEQFCNLTSWYVKPEFRSGSIELLLSVLTQEGYIFTNLTPSERTVKLVRALGFRVLECRKLVCGPSLFRRFVRLKSVARSRRFPAHHLRVIGELLLEWPLIQCLKWMRPPCVPSASDQGVRISGGIDLVRPKLTETDQQLLDDHRQCGHFLIEHEGDYCYIVTLKRKVGFPRRSISHFVASDILHCSNGSIASRHWTRLCELIRGQDRSLAVIADERFFPKERPEGLSLPYNSFFHAQTEIEPTEIDTLYTELPLLGLGFSPSALAVK